MYKFIGNCTQLNGDDITKMVDHSVEIDYEELYAEIPQKELREIFPGYDWDVQGGLQLHNDWCVKFYKSYYQGNECLYIWWSAIEHIWIKSKG